jgi:outer membrane protein assembly factor BamB
VLYQPNREGVLWALTPAGRELWNFRINNTMSHPLVHGDRIYIGTERLLYCLGLDGKKLWAFETQGETWWRPAAWDGKVYFTSCDCNIYCVDTATRQLAWKFRAQGEPSYMPPPFASFELSVKKSVDDSGFAEGEGGRKYSAAFDEEEGGKFYKSSVTYRMSSQYAAKGKYQKDSDTEGL